MEFRIFEPLELNGTYSLSNANPIWYQTLEFLGVRVLKNVDFQLLEFATK